MEKVNIGLLVILTLGLFYLYNENVKTKKLYEEMNKAMILQSVNDRLYIDNKLRERHNKEIKKLDSALNSNKKVYLYYIQKTKEYENKYKIVTSDIGYLPEL